MRFLHFKILRQLYDCQFNWVCYSRGYIFLSQSYVKSGPSFVVPARNSTHWPKSLVSPHLRTEQIDTPAVKLNNNKFSRIAENVDGICPNIVISAR